ncbi:outer membrane lipoprotein chaperone LolA [Hydrogenovibrio halophilus]|uniref:outer membrane lipoprotein chaperone LolA n=1 Tax=Hydrogenovibrio halophilus TaxID=373391 RepID=UPI00039D6387|nr:outer membrane lipoprotein chaperone LolA [Hydrogenovibrio halophilus]
MPTWIRKNTAGRTGQWVLTLGMWLFASTSVWAERADIAHLDAFLDSLETYQADFVQTQPDESTFSQNRSEGHFVLERPGLLKWVYQSPTSQTIVVDGQNVWIWDQDLDQVTVQNLNELERDFPLSWLLYDAPLTERFTIIAGSVKDGVHWFNLQPREGTFFQSLEVALDENGRLVQLWMYQSSDNITKVRFENIQQNAPVAMDQFRFQPPKGVDVIGLE